jgi:hypothetical protein
VVLNASVTTVIAVYAAAVATAGVGLGFFTWWRGNSTVLRVSVHGDITLKNPRACVTAVRVTTINDSPFDVTIARVFVYSIGDPGRLWMVDTGEQGLPRTIPARQRVDFSFDISEGSLFADESVMARIWTAAGKEFLSSKSSLLPSPQT